MANVTRHMLQEQAHFTRQSLHGGSEACDLTSLLDGSFLNAQKRKAEEKANRGAMPSMEELLLQLEKDELVQLEEEERSAALRSTQDDFDRLPVVSRAQLEEKRKAAEQEDDDDWPFGAPPVPDKEKEQNHVKEPEIVVPSMADILRKLEDEPKALHAHSTAVGSQDDHASRGPDCCVQSEAERVLAETSQTHTPDIALAYRRPHINSMQFVRDVREHFDTRFEEVTEDAGCLLDDIGWLATREGQGLTPAPQPLPKPAEKKVETEYRTHYEYMQDVLQGHKKKEITTGQDLNLEAKPPNKRVESLPGMHTLGAPKKPARKPGQVPTALKKGGEMEKKIRHANAGGSLETMFEEDDDPDAKIPECDVLFGGKPIRFSSVPQFFSCILDGQRDDWKHIPKHVSRE